MFQELKQTLSSQFLAAIKMLENAIDICPQNVWNQEKDFYDFWYITYHTLFFIDFYLTDSPDDYKQFGEIGLTELDPEGILPHRVFTKDELKSFLEHCRVKCKNTINNLNTEKAASNYKFGSLEMTYLELLFYNMRHVQHHTGQLNLILRQQINSAPKWVRSSV